MTGLRITTIVAALTLAACDQSPVPTALEDNADIMTATESFRNFGSWSAHINALVTAQLSEAAEVAKVQLNVLKPRDAECVSRQ